MKTACALTRVVIVQDHTLMREGLAEILRNYEDIQVVGEAGNSEEAISVVALQRPDIVLLDVEIPGGEVTSTVMRIKAVSPGTSILVLGVHDRAELVRGLLDLGVKGYLLKNATRLQLLAAIRSASSDDERVMLFVSRQSFTRPDEPDAQVLSARERDVLELVAAARSNAQIAAELSVTEATVKRHLRNIFVKLGAVSRIDAVNKGIAAAQISPPRPYYAARS